MPCPTPPSRRAAGAVLAARAALLACALLLAGCATKTTVAPPSAAAVVAPPPSQAAATTSNGALRPAADEMTKLFAMNMPVCHYDTGTDLDHKRPAFLCSGIIIRGATSGPDWNSWDVPPKDFNGIEAGGVSFSWIRQDATFSDLSASGYTLLPQLGPYSDPNKFKMGVACAFPLDAWTDYRNNKGCGFAPPYSTGDVCQKQGIVTGGLWALHYQQAPAGVPQYYNQCGFDVYTAASQPNPQLNGDAFYAMITARTALMSVNTGYAYYVFGIRNEIRIMNWDNRDVIEQYMPIQSFYYRAGSMDGRKAAMSDQQRFFKKYNVRIPVVRITPPTVNWFISPTYPAAAFQFFQDPNDQSV